MLSRVLLGVTRVSQGIVQESAQGSKEAVWVLTGDGPYDGEGEHGT